MQACETSGNMWTQNVEDYNVGLLLCFLLSNKTLANYTKYKNK